MSANNTIQDAEFDREFQEWDEKELAAIEEQSMQERLDEELDKDYNNP